MTAAWQVGVAANLIVSVAYLAIVVAIARPLLRDRLEGLNLLGLATAAIFLSCAVHHAGHALVVMSSAHDHGSGFGVALAAWDVVTMAVGVWYWTLRRGYGSMIGSGQLFADLRSQRREAALQGALRRVATAVAEEWPPDAVFALVAEVLGELLDVECALVARFDATEATVVGTHGDEGGHLGRRFPLASEAGLGTVHRSGRAARVAYADLPADPVGAEILGEGYHHGVAAPIVAGARVWGAVLVATTRPDGLVQRGLEPRLAQFGELVGLAVANADARARLAEAAATDGLTGLANHRTFHERLTAEASRAERHERPLSLVLLDLDWFTSVNDLHGHAAGDQVLAEVGRRLRAVAREEDVVARVGGEEFAILLPDADELGALQVAQRVRRAIGAEPFPPAGHLTVSGGICSLERAGHAAAMLKLADGALYWAKAHGRDACVIYTPEVVESLSAEERADKLVRGRTLAGLRALAQAVDARDHTTLAHSERVAALAVRLAAEVGWPEDDRRRLREAGLLHDVGKIGVPDAVLFKPGSLTADEYAQIQRHVELGAQIVSEVLDPEQVTWVREHHERIDGSGYPRGGAGGVLAEGSMILAIADAWDAMTAPRPYRGALDVALALEEIRRGSGTQFSPGLVALMERMAARGVPELRGASADGPLLAAAAAARG